MRHIWLLVLVLFSCSHGALFPPDSSRYDQLVIVGTNDVHGYLRPVETDLGGAKVVQGGAEWFAGYSRILEKKFGDRFLLLDGGDMFQGTLESNLFHGESVVKVYNLLPYRAVAVGNHEFDYGPRHKGDPDRLGHLKDRMLQANYPFVQANTFWKGNGRLWREKNLFPSVLVTAGGYRVGIIGLTTESTPAKTLPQNVAKLDFREFVEPTIREANQLRARGAEIVVITAHEGGEEIGEPLYRFLQALPAGTVDALVSGHSHTEIHTMVAGVPVIQSKTRGLYFGRIDLFVDKKTRKVEPSLTRIHGMHSICGNWFRNTESCDPRHAREAMAAGKAKLEDFLPLRGASYEGEEVKPDPAVRAVLAPYLAEADRHRGELLGEAQREFSCCGLPGNEVGELFMDAFHARFPEAKVVYLNGGGFRRPFAKGRLTYGDLYEVNPFDNFAVEVKMTGRQLRELARVGVSGSQMLPVVWGVRLAYFDRDDPAFDRDQNGDGRKEKWERDRLVPRTGLVWEKSGKPVRDDEEFWVATSDYLAAGGDHTELAFKGIPGSRRKFFDIRQHDVVAEYLRQNPGLGIPPPTELRVNAVK